MREFKRSKIILLIILTLAIHSWGINADVTYGNASVKRIISVYDGDTFRCDLYDFPAIIGSNIGVRIYGIDTPEIRDKRPAIKALANKAKQFAKSMLMGSKVIVLKNMRRGKYFRIVAEVYIDEVNLGEELIKRRLAKPYYGGTKPKWKVSLQRKRVN